MAEDSEITVVFVRLSAGVVLSGSDKTKMEKHERGLSRNGRVSRFINNANTRRTQNGGRRVSF